MLHGSAGRDHEAAAEGLELLERLEEFGHAVVRCAWAKRRVRGLPSKEGGTCLVEVRAPGRAVVLPGFGGSDKCQRGRCGHFGRGTGDTGRGEDRRRDSSSRFDLSPRPAMDDEDQHTK